MTALGSRDSGLCARYGRDVSVISATPNYVLRPKQTADVQQAILAARQDNIAVLAVGAQTSTTGASVAVGGGLLIDTTTLNADVLHLDAEVGRMVCPPGMTLAAVNALAHQHGWELPVDPSSAATCTVSGAVSTNASGPSSFAYGAMDRWVQAVELIDGTGRVRQLQRANVSKQAMGPAALRDPVQWVVGAEGTLGVLTEITLRLRRRPAALIGAFIGFAHQAGLLAAVAQLVAGLRGRSDGQIGAPATTTLRAVEWLDAACCDLMRGQPSRLRIPTGQGGGLFVVLEASGADAQERGLQRLTQLLTSLSTHAADVDAAQVMLTTADLAAFERLRHFVPDHLNRCGRALNLAAGGGKLSTDWSAPLTALPALLAQENRLLAEIGITERFRFGHIGDGHPHLNILCSDAVIRRRVFDTLAKQLVHVAAAGGVPTSEHGVGKLKRSLVAPYLPLGAQQAWSGLKRWLDPDGILAPGNIFEGTIFEITDR